LRRAGRCERAGSGRGKAGRLAVRQRQVHALRRADLPAYLP
jgi:hypothetical protein